MQFQQISFPQIITLIHEHFVTSDKACRFSRICINSYQSYKMLPSTLPPTPNPTLSLLHKLHFNAHFIRIRPISKSHICLAFPPSNQNPMGEEARWLREEQRWLREEQRWLREESRWNAERQALLQEINSLQLRIQELERLNSQQGASASENVAKLVQVLKEGDLVKNANRIADSGTSALPLVVEAAENEEEIVVKQVISTPEKKETIIKGETLRIGSEGDEVQAMQNVMELGSQMLSHSLWSGLMKDQSVPTAKDSDTQLVMPVEGRPVAEASTQV